MTSRDDVSLDPTEAFRELAQMEFGLHSIESVMTTISELVKRTVNGADEVSVTFLEGDTPRTVAFTGQLVMDLDERQYERGYGPCLDGSAAGELVSIPDMANESRWPDWTRTATERGCGSSLTAPVPLQRQLSAALNVYSRSANAFDDDAQETARTFASYAGVAISNMHLYESTAKLAEQLDVAMQSRAVIEQAKGILMGQRLCTAEEAFNILVDLSQRSNRKLRVVAEALVESAVSTDGSDST
jgi:GAF domain-containing protein